MYGLLNSPHGHMKTALSVFLLVSFTGSLFHLDEVAKIPVLINHFNAYCASGQDKSFRTFLAVHYLQAETHELPAQDNADRRLPYKSIQQMHLPLSMLHESPGEFHYFSGPQDRYPDFSAEEKPTCSAFGIWQPPRLG